MYESAADYYADLGRMRNEASTIVGKVRQTTANAPTYRFTIHRFEKDGEGPVSLHFSMPDFYLQGIQIHNKNILYRFHGSTFTTIINCMTETLKFKEDYAAMGWDKSNDQTTVALKDVNAAFFEILGKNPNKKAFLSIVIAFAEGFRFAKIANKVANGEPIGGKELDWSAAGATVEKGS